jgi:hypothetical protein
MLMTNKSTAVHLAIVAGVLIGGAADRTEAQSSRKPMATLILGEITTIAVRDMNDPASGGRIVVDGRQITLPENLLIGLPSGQKSLRALLLDAPAECRSQQPPQSGLAVSDSCRGGRPPALARVVASASASGELVASVVMIQKDSNRTLARIKPRRGAQADSYRRQPSGTAAARKPSGAQPK